jgi:hypothetical protein
MEVAYHQFLASGSKPKPLNRQSRAEKDATIQSNEGSVIAQYRTAIIVSM